MRKISNNKYLWWRVNLIFGWRCFCLSSFSSCWFAKLSTNVGLHLFTWWRREGRMSLWTLLKKFLCFIFVRFHLQFCVSQTCLHVFFFYLLFSFFFKDLKGLHHSKYIFFQFWVYCNLGGCWLYLSESSAKLFVVLFVSRTLDLNKETPWRSKLAFSLRLVCFQGSWRIIRQNETRNAATFGGKPKRTTLLAAPSKELLLPANRRGPRSRPPPPRDSAAGDWRSACWPLSSYTLSSSFRPPIIPRWWAWRPASHQRRARRMKSDRRFFKQVETHAGGVSKVPWNVASKEAGRVSSAAQGAGTGQWSRPYV